MENNNQLATTGNQDLAAMFGQAVAEQNINDALLGGINTSSYLPTLSLRGREWRFKEVGADVENRHPEKFLHVFILTSRPNISKAYYKNPYTPDNAKPDCASSDGIYPDKNVEHPQSQSCQVCPKNAWGSKIGLTGKQAKACSDSKMIIVALAENPSQVYQVKLPATSLKPLGIYIKELARQGIPADAAITRLTFADAEFPQVEFFCAGTVQKPEQYKFIKEQTARQDVQDTLKTNGNAVLTQQPAPVQIQPAPVTHAAIQPVVTQQPVVETQTVEEIHTPEATAPGNINDVLAKWGQ